MTNIVFTICLASLVALRCVSAESEFDWGSIEPSSKLVYHDCYDTLKCARLQVPMDWIAADSGAEVNGTVAIAIAMLPAVVSPNASSYGGTIITNPGGPASRGVGFIRSHGKFLQDIVDSPDKKHFDVVSFDPRGVGDTTPTVNCFLRDPLARAAMILENRQIRASRSNVASSMPYTVAVSKAFGRRCRDLEVLPFVNTPSVARDMVAMVDKIEELRNSLRLGAHRRMSSAEPQPRINYLGFSYGTILGNYFASLFPGRVGRMVLDGVSDAYDYSSGPVRLLLLHSPFKVE
jgi:pimeloyl-ACP methyl ester carboxylesterase